MSPRTRPARRPPTIRVVTAPCGCYSPEDDPGGGSAGYACKYHRPLYFKLREIDRIMATPLPDQPAESGHPGD